MRNSTLQRVLFRISKPPVCHAAAVRQIKSPFTLVGRYNSKHNDMIKLFTIKLSFSNAYLISENRAILIDSGVEGEEHKILKAMSQVGIKPGQISLILHTHAHFDHTGSTAKLASMLKIPTAVHPADQALLRSGRMNTLTALGVEAALLKLVVNRPFPGLTPDLLVDEAFDLSPFGVTARILHTPGHTAGSLSILLPDGKLIVGDLMMGGLLGGSLFPSRPRLPYYAEDLAKLRASIQRVLSHNPHTIYPGHGGPLQALAVKAYFTQVT
jgi:hydroxyacylglutathione hydrolase